MNLITIQHDKVDYEAQWDWIEERWINLWMLSRRWVHFRAVIRPITPIVCLATA